MQQQPKERTTRTGMHQPSVKGPKRSFAVQGTAVEHVRIGSALEASANDILGSYSTHGGEGTVALAKKKTQTMKREVFLQKLDLAKTPYSKSHNRRLKRKAKEQIATGMSDIQQALAALEDPLHTTRESSEKEKYAMDTTEASAPSKASASSKSLKIGEGKAATLSKSQRKGVLELERLRQPLILTNSTFASNPFSTIRTHAQNTLLKHQAPRPAS